MSFYCPGYFDVDPSDMTVRPCYRLVSRSEFQCPELSSPYPQYMQFPYVYSVAPDYNLGLGPKRCVQSCAASSAPCAHNLSPCPNILTISDQLNPMGQSQGLNFRCPCCDRKFEPPNDPNKGTSKELKFKRENVSFSVGPRAREGSTSSARKSVLKPVLESRIVDEKKYGAVNPSGQSFAGKPCECTNNKEAIIREIRKMKPCRCHNEMEEPSPNYNKPSRYTSTTSYHSNPPLEKQRSSEKPQDLQKQRSSEKPQVLQKQRSSEKPQDMQKQRSSEKPQDMQKQRSSEKPQDMQKQRSSEKPQDMKKQRSSEKPQGLQKQRSSEKPPDLERSLSEKPEALEKPRTMSERLKSFSEKLITSDKPRSYSEEPPDLEKNISYTEKPRHSQNPSASARERTSGRIPIYEAKPDFKCPGPRRKKEKTPSPTPSKELSPSPSIETAPPPSQPPPPPPPPPPKKDKKEKEPKPGPSKKPPPSKKPTQKQKKKAAREQEKTATSSRRLNVCDTYV